MYATTTFGLVRAPRALVYAALLDPEAVTRWRVPDEMTAEVHEWEPRVGGRFRVTLTYTRDDAGKSGAHTDTYAGHFAELVPDEKVVEVLAFEADAPGLTGEMRFTTTLRDVDGGVDGGVDGDADGAVGTEVRMVHDGVPDGVRPEDNEAGSTMALANLAAYVEGRVGA